MDYVWIGMIVALSSGCTARQAGDDSGGDGTSNATGDTSSGDAGASQSGAAEAGGSGSGSGSGAGDDTAGPPPSTCVDGADFQATAELIDSGLGPGGATVTIDNCTEVEALVYQDCCFGAAFHLQRRDTPDEMWRDTVAGVACDCKGPVDPLVIEPGGTLQFETNPSHLDSEPICGVGSLEYRYLLQISRSDCEDCGQQVATTAFDWYCEG